MNVGLLLISFLSWSFVSFASTPNYAQMYPTAPPFPKPELDESLDPKSFFPGRTTDECKQSLSNLRKIYLEKKKTFDDLVAKGASYDDLVLPDKELELARIAVIEKIDTCSFCHFRKLTPTESGILTTRYVSDGSCGVSLRKDKLSAAFNRITEFLTNVTEYPRQKNGFTRILGTLPVKDGAILEELHPKPGEPFRMFIGVAGPRVVVRSGFSYFIRNDIEVRDEFPQEEKGTKTFIMTFGSEEAPREIGRYRPPEVLNPNVEEGSANSTLIPLTSVSGWWFVEADFDRGMLNERYVTVGDIPIPQETLRSLARIIHLDTIVQLLERAAPEDT